MQRKTGLRRDTEKSRAFQAKRKKLKRGADMRRRKRIRARNPERAERLFERNYLSEEFVTWIHSLACVVSGSGGSSWDPIVAAHVRSKGAGGRWSDIVPMLRSLHDELHQIGVRSFEKKYEVDLQLAAAAVVQRWKAFTKAAA